MAFLNSSDLHKMQNPAGESPAAPKPNPNHDPVVLIQEMDKMKAQAKERDAKFQRMLEDRSRETEILRTQLAQRVEPTPREPAPPATTNWLDLLGVQAPQEMKENQTMAQTPSNMSAADIERMVEAKLAERDRLAYERHMAEQQQVEVLKQKFKTEHADIMEDPEMSDYARKTMNSIESKYPGLPKDQVYDMAINATRDAAATFRQSSARGQGKQQATQSPASPYGVPNYSAPTQPQQRGPRDPFEGRVELGDRESMAAERRKEQQEIRAMHLKKFGR